MAKMSLAKFESLVPTLIERLTLGLEHEQEDNALAPDFGSDPLWQTPKVDSKTVAKLSPVVKEITGHRLDPRWIQKGGYPAIAVAVADIINKIKQYRVTPAAPPAVAPAKEVAVSAI